MGWDSGTGDVRGGRVSEPRSAWLCGDGASGVAPACHAIHLTSAPSLSSEPPEGWGPLLWLNKDLWLTDSTWQWCLGEQHLVRVQGLREHNPSGSPPVSPPHPPTAPSPAVMGLRHLAVSQPLRGLPPVPSCARGQGTFLASAVVPRGQELPSLPFPPFPGWGLPSLRLACPGAEPAVS